MRVFRPILMLLGALATPLLVAAAEVQPECVTYDSADTPCALADGSVVRGVIAVQGGRNYFWFGVPSPDMHLVIRLTDLPADYDLFLFSDQVANPEQPLLSSVTPETEPERIETVLHDVGTYLIEVVDDPNVQNVADVPYTLTFGLQPAAPAPAPEPTARPTPVPAPTPLPNAPLVNPPAVIGLTPNTAAKLLRDAGFITEAASVDAYSPAGAGTVATQDPPPTARLAPGSTIRLGVASGRVAVPNVRGRPEAEAFAVLRAAGFDIQMRRRADASVPSGLALGTNPGDGAVLAPGTSVELLISQGH